MHGNGKVICSNIAMLERNTKAPTRGENMLRYVAATSDDAGFLLNKHFYQVWVLYTFIHIMESLISKTSRIPMF